MDGGFGTGARPPLIGTSTLRDAAGPSSRGFGVTARYAISVSIDMMGLRAVAQRDFNLGCEKQ